MKFIYSAYIIQSLAKVMELFIKPFYFLTNKLHFSVTAEYSSFLKYNLNKSNAIILTELIFFPNQ